MNINNFLDGWNQLWHFSPPPPPTLRHTPGSARVKLSQNIVIVLKMFKSLKHNFFWQNIIFNLKYILTFLGDLL